MITSFSEINNILINEISASFEENYDFYLLMKKYPFLDYNVLYSILYSTGKYREQLYDYLCQKTFDESKILIMSDTHYGSKYQNMRYTYDMFDFAVKNGIHIILHGGDILEGSVNSRKSATLLKQAKYFLNIYPFDSSIKTYALFGNHDYLAIERNEKIYEILYSRDDIEMLGFKKIYLNWCGNVISLQHEIEKFKLNFPFNAEYISFKGHSHFYHVKEKKKGKSERIYIPPMCDDPVCYMSNPQLKYGIVKPGFLTAEIDGSDIIVTNYEFTSCNIVRENEFKKVLKR